MFIRMLLIFFLFSCSKAGVQKPTFISTTMESIKLVDASDVDAELSLKLAEVHAAATEYINTVDGTNDPEPSEDEYVNLARSILKLDEEMAIRFSKQGYWAQIQEFIKASRKEVARLQGQDVEGLGLAGEDDKYLIPPDTAGMIVVTAIGAAVYLSHKNYTGSPPSGKNSAAGAGIGAAAVFFWIANKNYSEIKKDAPGLTGLMVGSGIGVIAGLILFQVHEVRQRMKLDKIRNGADFENNGMISNDNRTHRNTAAVSGNKRTRIGVADDIATESVEGVAETVAEGVATESFDAVADAASATADAAEEVVEGVTADAATSVTESAVISVDEDAAAGVTTDKGTAVPSSASGEIRPLVAAPLLLDSRLSAATADFPVARDALLNAVDNDSFNRQRHFIHVVSFSNLPQVEKNNLISSYVFHQENVKKMSHNILDTGLGPEATGFLTDANTKFNETTWELTKLFGNGPEVDFANVNIQFERLKNITNAVALNFDRLDLEVASRVDASDRALDLQKLVQADNMAVKRYATAIGALPETPDKPRLIVEFRKDLDLTRKMLSDLGSKMAVDGSRLDFDAELSTIVESHKTKLKGKDVDVAMDDKAVKVHALSNLNGVLSGVNTENITVKSSDLTVSGPQVGRLRLTSAEEAHFQFLDEVNEFILYLGQTEF